VPKNETAESHGQPLKQEGGLSAVLCDDSGASADFLQQFNDLLAPWFRSLYGNWGKDVFSSPWFFAVLLSAAAWLPLPAQLQWGLKMGLSESYCMNPSIFLWPGVLELLRLGVCRHFWRGLLVPSQLGSVPFQRPFIMMLFHLPVTLLSGSASVAAKSYKLRVSTVLPQSQTCLNVVMRKEAYICKQN